MTGQRLSPLAVLSAVLVTGFWVALFALPLGVLLALLWTPWSLLLVLAAVVMAVGLAALLSWLRWRNTTFSLSADRFVLRSGVLKRTTRTFTRQRIRAIDLAAGPFQRLLGLASLHIGTAEQTGDDGSAVLSPLSREVAERLQAELVPSGGADGHVLARFQPGWMRYAPLSWVPFVIAAGVYGVVGQFAEGFGELVWEWVASAAAGAGWWAVLGVLVGIPMLIGLVGATLIHAELWWNHRLERDSGVLRVRRGLLTTRSVSLPEERLRGIRIAEPLGVRLAGAAQLEALAIGLQNQRQGGKDDGRSQSNVLVPFAPRDVVDGVAAAVLGSDSAATDPQLLEPHPRAAFTRRALRAVWVVLGWVVVAGSISGLLLPGWWWLVPAGAVVLAAAGLALAHDLWRNLGHRLDDEHLVSRSGTLHRITDAIERDAIIGWNVRQSVFQKRRGLVTVVATTGAGSGAVSVLDAATGSGIALADAATPGLLTPFLCSAEATSSPVPAPR